MRKKASNWRAQYEGITFSRLFGHLPLAGLGKEQRSSCNIPCAPDVTMPALLLSPDTHSHYPISGNEQVSGDETSVTYSPAKTLHSEYKLHPPKVTATYTSANTVNSINNSYQVQCEQNQWVVPGKGISGPTWEESVIINQCTVQKSSPTNSNLWVYPLNQLLHA